MSLKANEQLSFGDTRVLAPFAAFLATGTAFVVTEMKVTQPILRLSLLSLRTPARMPAFTFVGRCTLQN